MDWLPLKDRFRNRKVTFACNVKNNIKLPQSMIDKYEIKKTRVMIDAITIRILF